MKDKGTNEIKNIKEVRELSEFVGCICCSPPLSQDDIEIMRKYVKKEKLKSATKIYNAGYRKLPEDSVVLSREEHQALKKQIEYWEYETKVAREEIDNAVKETAEKIIERAKSCGDNFYIKICEILEDLGLK